MVYLDYKIFKTKHKNKPTYFNCLICNSIVKNDRVSRCQHRRTKRHKRASIMTPLNTITEGQPITPDLFYISSNFSINIERKKDEIKEQEIKEQEIKDEIKDEIKEQKIKQPPQKIQLPPRSNNKILNGYDIFIFILDGYFNKKMKGDNSRKDILSSNNFLNLKQELITSYAMLQEPNLLKVNTDRDIFKQIITHQSKHSKTSIYKFLFQLDKIQNLLKK